MVVEDEELLLQAITKKLTLSGMEVLSCSGGQQGLDYLNTLGKLPDVIWLDYYLKDMDGLAFMHAIKTNPKWFNIPVFVVSNSASPEKVHNMMALGAKKYVLKANYRLDELIHMLEEFLEKETEHAADSDESSEAPVQPPAAPSN